MIDQAIHNIGVVAVMIAIAIGGLLALWLIASAVCGFAELFAKKHPMPCRAPIDVKTATARELLQGRNFQD
jgi:hypothetical protein